MAAVAADPNYQSHATAAESAGSCLRSFQECVQRAASIHPRELSLVEDQLARFSIWIANIKVFASGRASLDHRLREAPDVQDIVIGLFEALAFRIQSCSRCLESLDSKESQKLDESLLEMDPKFDQSIRVIASEISLLHRFSNTIRRASKESQNHKAAESYHIRDDEGNDAEPFLTELFSYHIRDQFPEVEEDICQRLAATMVLRRKRILYRRSRYGDTAIRTPQIPSQPQVTLPKVRPTVAVPEQPQESEQLQATVATSKSAIRSLAQSATTLALDDFHKASVPSVISVSKTVALSNHEDLVFPPAPLGRIERKYKELKKLRKELLEKAGILVADGEAKAQLDRIQEYDWSKSVKAIGEVTCPFCFYALPAQDVVDDKKWKLHVKDDLDAYVCMFKDCNSPHELYGHSSSWLKHMREHAMRWRCTSKSHGEVVCESRSDYLSHIKVAHQGKFSDAQLGILADKNCRVMGPLFKSCPLCGKEEVDGIMEDHIVGHLRFLALKSLPTFYDDESGEEDAGSENGSSFASKPRSRSTIRNDPERHTPSTFEDIGDVEEILKTFTRTRTETDNKHANPGGYHSHIKLPYPTIPLLPPPEKDQVEWFSDPSIEFVEDSVFDGIPYVKRRQFEWGFIPVCLPEESGSLKDDPILQAFLPETKPDISDPIYSDEEHSSGEEVPKPIHANQAEQPTTASFRELVGKTIARSSAGERAHTACDFCRTRKESFV
ncbi:hypothetical protein F4820DRAFT_453963 [Hypoxylon rubiginosum]|uniref:Uncharacterized protein n=1 Tax=Hypoxylon rubiginosum TaxID=110542 RepID=A0ACB9YJN6_9PEZI|nr:hypothetical protein F4820DRAFT_453963 [Hypoxylon rubiginosum]